MLWIERRPLADQYDFYACGDLAFAETSRESMIAYADRMKDEIAYAAKHGGTFRDGSRFAPGSPGEKTIEDMQGAQDASG